MLFFDSIHYAYDKSPVLNNVSFTAGPGEITCVIGPSGCGKSTLLGLAAGLLPTQAGEIRLDDTLLGRKGFDLPPEQRPVGLVFQEGALFPHMTVAGNVGFGVGERERSARVAELLELVGLSAEAGRYPHTLSGGQRQRVALARALAPSPRALLFDEPYANLDQELRRALRIEARETVRRSGTVGLFVTHDPDDVMALADQVVVLREGYVLQTGTPRELFDKPANATVARLFGRAQSLPAVRHGNVLQTSFGDWPLDCVSPASESALAESGASLELSVRPESLTLATDASGRLLNDIRIAGPDDLVEVTDGEGARLFVKLLRPHDFEPGCRVSVTPLPGSVFVSPA
ncbi:MAG: ABC transporter ATP-binding protein [Pseudomonadota bacterium]